MATNACDASSSGWVTTSGRPSSAPMRNSGTSGTCPSSGTHSWSASSRPPPAPNSSYALPSSPRNHDMFSITPITSRFTFWLMYAARWATRWAAGCGVVTMSTSARGRNWAIDSAMSPVPGGMSTTRKSGSSQCTSVRNCSSALCSIGPPHDGLVLTGEEPHRDEVHAVRLGRDDDVVEHHGRVLQAEHARHREAPHVGVHGDDLVTAPREGDGEVRADGRLPDRAVPRRHREHSGP